MHFIFQRAISYSCTSDGEIICQNGWKEAVHPDDRDPLNPCSQPICDQECVNGLCISPNQ